MGWHGKDRITSYESKYKWTRVLDLKVDLDVEMQTQSWLEQGVGSFGDLRSEEGMP